MPTPYSNDIRQRAIAKKEEGKSVKEIMKELSVSRTFVYNLFKLYGQTGDIRPREGNIGRKPALDENDLKKIETKIGEMPDITLEKLREELNLDVALSTLCDTINYKLALKYKKRFSANRSKQRGCKNK